MSGSTASGSAQGLDTPVHAKAMSFMELGVSISKRFKSGGNHDSP